MNDRAEFEQAQLIFQEAVSHKNAGRLENAEQLYRQLLAKYPELFEAWHNLANVLKVQGKFNPALECYRKALSLRPDDAETQFNQATTYLLLGEWEKGWQGYESRLALKTTKRANALPIWRGEDISSKGILVYPEQGFGDAIQFARYLPLLRERAERVYFESPAPLRRLFETLQGVDAFVDPGETMPQCALQVSLLSLPKILNIHVDKVLPCIPYFAVKEEWKRAQTLNPSKNDLKVGFCWAGNPQYGQDRFRSTSLDIWKPLFRIPGISWFSLQKGEPSRVLETFEFRETIVPLGEKLQDFADTAAAISQLDLIISTDTAVPHLAGALGKPVWLLLSLVPDWRWLLDRQDSPWYPSMKLFRQIQREDWGSVIEELRRELQERIGVNRQLLP